MTRRAVVVVLFGYFILFVLMSAAALTFISFGSSSSTVGRACCACFVLFVAVSLPVHAKSMHHYVLSLCLVIRLA